MRVGFALLLAFLCNVVVSNVRATSCEKYFKEDLANGFLKDLVGLQVTDPTGQYAFGLCTDAVLSDKATASGAGVLQAGGVVHGRWGQFYAHSGRGWIELVYMGGDAAAAAAGNCTAGWSAHTVLICDDTERSGTFELVGRAPSSPSGGSGCYSLFQLLHRRLCRLDSGGGGGSGLPTAAIVLIVLLSLFAAYLLVGVAIQRLVFRRRGLEMLPNYAAWRRLGDALADGCDFVCRSGEVEAEPTGYQPVSDNHATSLAEEDDENLLRA